MHSLLVSRLLPETVFFTQSKSPEWAQNSSPFDVEDHDVGVRECTRNWGVCCHMETFMMEPKRFTKGGAKIPVVKTEVSDYVWITVWHINCWTSCWRPFFFACLQEMLCIVCKPYVAYSCFQG